MSSPDLTLRERADALASRLPPLLADARHLAASVLLGEHGRRQPGHGSEFWQFRPVMAGDEARNIDWRRSARSDGYFAREREWQAAQTISFLVDDGQSMAFSAQPKRQPTKRDRAALLAMALAVLLEQAGERLALVGQPAGRGARQLLRMADDLCRPAGADYAQVRLDGLPARSKAVLLSDFMAPVEQVIAAVAAAADRGISGALVQVIDPSEEDFPFKGRTVFHSVGGSLNYEVQKAAGLRADYQSKLAERRDALRQLSRQSGWQFLIHRTDQSAQSALLWLFSAIGRSSR